jgi:hypothetical protein
MAEFETAEMIARSRRVSAQAIFERRADLSGYPYRLLSVVSHTNWAEDDTAMAMAAAEYLMQFGWELVNIARMTQPIVSATAFMRRVQ